MDFFSAVLILVLYFVRPQDWLPGMAGANLIQPVALFALVAMLARRGLPDIRQVVATPLDFLMLLYGGYIVVTAPDPTGTFFEVLPLMIFYVVTRLAIDTPERLRRYLICWVATLVVLAAFGVGSLFGVDITGAKEITEKFSGRLALGTWIHNNPNSLGHSVVVAIPLVYLAMFWRSTYARRIAALAFALLAAYCVYKTESRGSFVAGLAVVTFGLSLGRPKFVQLLMFVFAITSATAILASLPRMDRVTSLRTDEGVQGRMMAWEIARTSAENRLYGDGWKQFEAYIQYENEMIKKATHSCYVRVAADLGFPGLFLYLGILWCGVRSLMGLRRALADDTEAERCRRILFVLLVGYMVSGWMIDRSYHTEFFLMAAAISAMYTLFRIPEPAAAEEPPTPEVLVGFGQDLKPKLLLEDAGPQRKKSWRRFGVVDGVVCFLLLQLTLGLWNYIMELM